MSKPPAPPVAPAEPKRRRARSQEAKQRVRATILEAGRAAFATQEFAKVSLRGIAAAAGYSPSVIYGLFEDRQDLFLAVREIDLEKAVEYMEDVLTTAEDPADRVRTLFLVATDYWRNHPEQYEVLYARPLHRPAAKYSDGSMFGQSTVAQRSGKLWEDTVRGFFATLPNLPMSVRLATQCLMLAMHGIVSIPPRQQSRAWLRSEELARATIDCFLTAWAVRARVRTLGVAEADLRAP